MSRATELEHVEGFGVETRSGRIGRVTGVIAPHAADDAGLLLVHTGGRACTVRLVPFADVEDVDCRSRKIVLAPRS